MSNIIDYLKWRGDLTFKQSPLNEIDALILSFISYVDFESYLSEINEKTLEKLNSEINSNSNNLTKKGLDRISMVRMSLEILEYASKTNRFKDVLILNYINEIDLNSESQFAVMTFKFPNNDFFVAYRGTDESIIGWKEDFNMLFLPEIPGQIKAYEYLNSLNLDIINNLYVGGHSKGGNLAIFASSNADIFVKDKIISIYNFDGPGFNDKFLENEGYKEIACKIKTYIPEESIIGMIFNRIEDSIIIKSGESGFLQHNVYFWEVLGNNFILTDISKQSLKLDLILKDLVNELSLEQRKIIVNTIFDFLAKIKVITVEDFYNLNFNTFQEFIKFSNDIPEDCKQSFLTIFKFLFNELKNKNLKK